MQVDCIKNSKLNIADKWLISLDRVTYVMPSSKMSLNSKKKSCLQNLLYAWVYELYFVENTIKFEHMDPEL